MLIKNIWRLAVFKHLLAAYPSGSLKGKIQIYPQEKRFSNCSIRGPLISARNKDYYPSLTKNIWIFLILMNCGLPTHRASWNEECKCVPRMIFWIKLSHYHQLKKINIRRQGYCDVNRKNIKWILIFSAFSKKIQLGLKIGRKTNELLVINRISEPASPN